jgi:hypothetical protein
MIPATLQHEYGANPPDDEPELECPSGHDLESLGLSAKRGRFGESLCPVCGTELVEDW